MQERTSKTFSTRKTGLIHVKVRLSDASRPKVQIRKKDVTLREVYRPIVIHICADGRLMKSIKKRTKLFFGKYCLSSPLVPRRYQEKLE